MQYPNRGRLAFWMFSRWCLEGSITADTRGSGQIMSRGPDKYGFISWVMVTGTGVLTSQGTRDQWSHSENDHQSGQGRRERSRRTYSRWQEDYRGQLRYSQRDNGYNASSRGRRQQEERRAWSADVSQAAAAEGQCLKAVFWREQPFTAPGEETRFHIGRSWTANSDSWTVFQSSKRSWSAMTSHHPRGVSLW